MYVLFCMWFAYVYNSIYIYVCVRICIYVQASTFKYVYM